MVRFAYGLILSTRQRKNFKNKHYKKHTFGGTIYCRLK